MEAVLEALASVLVVLGHLLALPLYLLFGVFLLGFGVAAVVLLLEGVDRWRSWSEGGP